jgi:pentatricopeptide repeat protein
VQDSFEYSKKKKKTNILISSTGWSQAGRFILHATADGHRTAEGLPSRRADFRGNEGLHWSPSPAGLDGYFLAILLCAPSSFSLSSALIDAYCRANRVEQAFKRVQNMIKEVSQTYFAERDLFYNLFLKLTAGCSSGPCLASRSEGSCQKDQQNEALEEA